MHPHTLSLIRDLLKDSAVVVSEEMHKPLSLVTCHEAKQRACALIGQFNDAWPIVTRSSQTGAHGGPLRGELFGAAATGVIEI